MDLSEITIFYDGTNEGTFVYDKNDSPVGGIMQMNISFVAGKPNMEFKIKILKKDINGNLIYNLNGLPEMKEMTFSNPKIYFLDSRAEPEKFLVALERLKKYKEMVTPQITFEQVRQDVIEKITG